MALIVCKTQRYVNAPSEYGDVPTHAYILVYPTAAMPERASFTVFRDAEAPRYEEGRGVQTKELLGPHASLQVHGDLRLFTVSFLEDGSTLTVMLRDTEGGLLSIQEGRVQLDDRAIDEGATILLPPAKGERHLAVTTLGSARLLRVVHGPGYGLVRRKDGSAARRKT